MQIVLITGLSPGNLASAVALKLCADHHRYKVYGVMRNISLAEQVYLQAKNMGVKEGSLNLVEFDLSLEQGCSGVVRYVIRKEARIDILINSGSDFPCHTVEELEMDKVLECFDENLFTHWRMIRNVLPQMRRNTFGRIVNIVSTQQSTNPSLSAATAALDSLSETTSTTLRPFNIYMTSYNQESRIPDSGSILGEQGHRKDVKPTPQSGLDNIVESGYDKKEDLLYFTHSLAVDAILSLLTTAYPMVVRSKNSAEFGSVDTLGKERPSEIITEGQEQ